MLSLLHPCPFDAVIYSPHRAHRSLLGKRLSPFDRAFDTSLASPLSGLEPLFNKAPSRLAVHEDEKSYRLTLDAPGVRTQDLRVSEEDGVLRLSGETKGEHRHVRFDHSVRLPKDVDFEEAEATHSDGVLTVVMRKRSAPAPRQLQVRAAATAAESSEIPEQAGEGEGGEASQAAGEDFEHVDEAGQPRESEA